MQKIIESIKQEFESSSTQTPQYKTWHKLFKKGFKKFLGSNGATDVVVLKPNHFDVGGFFTSKTGRVYYFSISDLRWSKDFMLLRRVADYKDFAGGANNFIPLESAESFTKAFNNVVS